MKFEFSAGGIVLQKVKGKSEVLVCQHSQHHGWVFPIHTGDYFNYLASNFGVSKIYAATNDCGNDPRGIGFCGLSPFATVWSSFRDTVYLFFVIVFILIGLGIMFRLKIDPRTVMTIENQIPKIIVTIIFVTLSFAIAGFLIDMMYAVTYTTSDMIDTAAQKATTNFSTPSFMQSQDIFDAANRIGGGANNNWGGYFSLSGKVGEAIGQSVGKTATGNVASDLVVGAITTYALTAVANKVSSGTNIINKIASAESKTWVGPLVALLSVGATEVFVNSVWDSSLSIKAFQLVISLVILIALIWALFRLWMALLGAYISILFHVVLSPFWIFFGLIPGSTISFGGWIRGIISNLIVFPVVNIMFLLGSLFMNLANNQTIFSPPFLGNPGTAGQMGALIGIGIIFMTPQAVKMMQEVFKAEGFKYTSAIGQAIGVSQGVVSGTGTAIVSPYGTLSHIRSFRQSGGLKGLFGGIAKPQVSHFPPQEGKH